MIIGKSYRMIIVFIVAFTSLAGCAELLDGPFNQGKNIVPSLLMANNGSDYVTYWDKESQSYKTYDQAKNTLLATAIFETEEDGPSQNFKVVGTSIVALTRLNDKEMQIQGEQGCVACHES